MKKLLILAGVIALTATTQCFAQEEATPAARPTCPIENCEKPAPAVGCPEKMHRPPCNMKKFEDELNLSAKQKEQAKQLREKQMEAAKPLFEQLRVKEQEARELRIQLRELRIQGKKDFEAILTDKQLKKLEKIKAERKQEFAKRPHRGMMHKRPPMPPQCPCVKAPEPPVEK